MPRRVLSIWIPHFHSRVEQLLDPSLLERPVVVASGGFSRGWVIDASPEAGRQGVEAGLSWRHAHRRCPDAVFIPYQAERYLPLVQQLGQTMTLLTPWVERFPGADDEFFADLGLGMTDDGLAAARRLQASIAAALQLPARIGLASGKLCARAACRRGTATPAADRPPLPILIPPGRERDFLAPLPVSTLWDLPPPALRHFHQVGLTSLAQVAALPVRSLMPVLGASAWHFVQLARGRDPRPVNVWTAGAVETVECAAEEGDRARLVARVEHLSGLLSERLIRQGRHARTVSLTLSLEQGQRLTATQHLKAPTCRCQALFWAGRALLDRLLERLSLLPNPTVERVIFSVFRLDACRGVQLGLFGAADHRPALDAALARLQDRFGEHAIRRGLTPPEA